MPKGKRPRQQGPQPKPKGNHTDKRHRRGSERSRERHDEPDGPAKKLKSSRAQEKRGGLTGEVGKSTVKLLPGAEFVRGDGETDMFVEHIETVDLTKDDEDEPDVLSMTEDEVQDHTLQLAAQGDHDVVMADDDDTQLLQLGLPSSGAAVSAPSDSPAKAAQARAGRF